MSTLRQKNLRISGKIQKLHNIWVFQKIFFSWLPFSKIKSKQRSRFARASNYDLTYTKMQSFQFLSYSFTDDGHLLSVELLTINLIRVLQFNTLYFHFVFILTLTVLLILLQCIISFKPTPKKAKNSLLLSWSENKLLTFLLILYYIQLSATDFILT